MTLVKSVEVNIGVKGDRESKAKLDDITGRAEALKKAFPEFKLKIDAAAASERLKVFRAQLAEATKPRTAEVKVKVDDSALAKLADKMKKSGGPAWLGPALLGLPAIATLGGVGAGAAIGLGGAAIAGGGALAAFGAVAKPVLADALKAEQAVSTAQNNYNAAIAVGTKQAVAYKAEQLAIGKAYANLSPAQITLSKQLGAMAQSWQNLKAAQTPVVAGALQPWLAGISTGLGNLKSVIKPMAGAVHDLGVSFGVLMGSSTFQDFMKWIGTTGAAVNRSAGGAVLSLLDGIMNLLPQFTPLMTGAASAIGRWGDEFARWSASQKAADQIHAFLQWFHDNGPVAGDLLKNIGKALAVLAPGLTAGGVAELRVVSGFFGLIAKLPKGIAGPLAEVAGALLLLNKLGVVSVGLKLLGGAGGAAGLWGKLLPGVALIGGALVATIIVKTLLDTASHGAGHDPWNRPFGADPTSKDPAKQGVSTWAGLGHQIESIFDGVRHAIAAAFSGAGSWLTSAGASVMHGLSGGITTGWAAVTGWLGGTGARIKGFFSGAGSWLTSAGASVMHGLSGGITTGWAAVTGWLSGLGKAIGGFFDGAKTWLLGQGQAIIGGLGDGLKAGWGAVAGWFSGLPAKILGALGIKSPPGWAIDAGKHIMGGLLKGITHGAGDVKGFFLGLAADIGGPLASVWKTISGVWGGSLTGGNKTPPAGALQQMAQQMLSARGWGNQWALFNALETREAGWSMTATNPGSGAYGLAQGITGPGWYYGQGGDPNTASGQLTAMMNYIASRYGSPAAAWAHEVQFGWYDQGGYLPPGLSLALNTTGRPETVGAGDIHVHFHGLVTDPNAAGRQVVQVLRAYKRHGGGQPLGIA